MADGMKALADASEGVGSNCQGYWIGRGFAVAVTGSMRRFEVSLLLQNPETTYANPLVGRLRWRQPVADDTDTVGNIDEKHVEAAFSNIGSVDMACTMNKAIDEEGGPLTRVSRLTFERTTRSWPRA